MRIILLGSGSYSGTPKLFCSCENCTRARKFPEYKRTRFSMYIPKINALIDPSPDLHYHLEHLNEKIERVLITHPHFDHIAGLPELQILRRVSFYSHEKTLKMAKLLQETFLGNREWSYVPLEFNRWYNFGKFRIKHFPTTHQPGDVSGGFIIEIREKRIVVTGDTGPEILKDKELLNELHRVDLLVSEMTHKHSIPKTHLGVEDAIKLAQKIDAKKTIFAHISHSNYTHEELEEKVGDIGIVGRDFMILQI
ncbi:MBL fold metallo-hydrolase [Thermococcus argininiproducens]|uniref:MBL fold metallo-hydrolase n=1 Tax=Thermococcus argininiproducens TaxID=2866384 RepID=A0A9E7SDB9_9EURY|nr:MBL fold metallo-hydrolase [Thermococcus argininiproducens]USH00625.1 MBL fold metallo-hydrolase [Thermococcus argininiproducens]